MAPSRGFVFLWPLRKTCSIQSSGQIHCRIQIRCKVSFSDSSFQDVVAASENARQTYVSRSSNPYLNLSIEHYLLQKSPPDSTILFLYTNRPCVVIGRNQNPWSEVNLRLLQQGHVKPLAAKKQFSEPEVLLVRRRSGGGAVFHDEGNVNYSVICPPSEFNRDKHAEMVVRALRKLGIKGIEVNERHDIVIDSSLQVGDEKDSLKMEPDILDQDSRLSLKVSGSAYKLTRLRALHHGTCLLSSRNLKSISEYLRSPAKPYIKARGVESVRSAVANLGVENSAFEQAVISEFAQTYHIEEYSMLQEPAGALIVKGENWVRGIVDDEYFGIEDIKKGTEELMSPEWIYDQTPQFELSNQVVEAGQGRKDAKYDEFLEKTSIYLKVRSGAVISSDISFAVDGAASKEDNALAKKMLHKKVHAVTDWKKVLEGNFEDEKRHQQTQIGNWLNSMLGNS